jgi:hypothetical protein
MNPQTSEGIAGLLEWSEPIIFDRLREAYLDHIRDGAKAMKLARLHAQVWRSLLVGDLPAFESLRGALVLQLAQAGLTLDHLAAADNQTMRELVAIVIARFRRTPSVAQGYRLAFRHLATRLGFSRAA